MGDGRDADDQTTKPAEQIDRNTRVDEILRDAMDKRISGNHCRCRKSSERDEAQEWVPGKTQTTITSATDSNAAPKAASPDNRIPTPAAQAYWVAVMATIIGKAQIAR